MYLPRRRKPVTRAPVRRLLQTLGQRPAQVGAMRDGAHDDAALQPLAEATHHGLDLGEFRHGGSGTL